MRTVAHTPRQMPRPAFAQRVVDGLRDMVEGVRGAREYRQKEDAALLRAMQEGGAEARKEVSKEDINAILARHGLRI